MNDDAVPLYPRESDLQLQKMEYPPGYSSSELPPGASGSAAVITAPPALNEPLPLLLGPENSVTTCPHCKCAVRTTIKHSVTSRTHITALLCSCFCCCCCLPYCMDSTRNTDHYCPNCLKYLGTYEK